MIDNFERALAAGDKDDSFCKGMEMILKQLLSVLEKAGASEIAAALGGISILISTTP